MTAETFLDGRVELHRGDCLEVLARLPEASVDAVVTDPPYHLTSVADRLGGNGATASRSNRVTGVDRRAQAGFMGQKWDGGDVAFRPETWQAVCVSSSPAGISSPSPRREPTIGWRLRWRTRGSSFGI